MFFTDHDVYRPSNWRMLRAEWLRSKGRYARKNRDDQYTILAKRFLTLREKCVDDCDEERLARQMPGIYYATRMYSRTDTDDRWTIEARVLADEPVEVIAHKQRTTTDVVFWYERLFFDVRDKLDSRDYIINRVLGPAVHRGLMHRDFDLFLKLYALIGGPVVVDVLIEQSGLDKARVGSRREVSSFFNGDVSDSLGRLAAVAARCLRAVPESFQTIFEAHHRLLQLEKESASSADANNLIVQNIQATLQSVPFHTAKQGALSTNPRLRVHEESGTELRADELVAAGVGLAVSIPDGLGDFTFPEASNDG